MQWFPLPALQSSLKLLFTSVAREALLYWIPLTVLLCALYLKNSTSCSPVGFWRSSPQSMFLPSRSWRSINCKVSLILGLHLYLKLLSRHTLDNMNLTDKARSYRCFALKIMHEDWPGCILLFSYI